MNRLITFIIHSKSIAEFENDIKEKIGYKLTPSDIFNFVVEECGKEFYIRLTIWRKTHSLIENAI